MLHFGQTLANAIPEFLQFPGRPDAKVESVDDRADNRLGRHRAGIRVLDGIQKKLSQGTPVPVSTGPRLDAPGGIRTNRLVHQPYNGIEGPYSFHNQFPFRLPNREDRFHLLYSGLQAQQSALAARNARVQSLVLPSEQSSLVEQPL